MSRDKTVRMANQIAGFFASQPGDRAAGVADHINQFWEPRMREELIDIAANGDGELSELVVQALPLVRRTKAG